MLAVPDCTFRYQTRSGAKSSKEQHNWEENQRVDVSSHCRLREPGPPSKSGGDLDLRSAGRFVRDHAAGHVWLGAETVATSSLSVTTAATPLPGPNTQVNDPALDNIQIFPSFAPFLHYTQSETTVAAAGSNIVVVTTIPPESPSPGPRKLDSHPRRPGLGSGVCRLYGR